MKTTLRAVIESLRTKLTPERQKAARRLLLVAEDDAAAGAMLDAPAEEPAADADPDDALWGGFWDAITQIGEKYKSGEMSAKDAGKKIMQYIKSHEQLTDGGTAADAGDDDGTEEGRRRPDYPALLKECRLAGFSPTDLDIVALGAMDAAQRKEFVAERLNRGGEDPRSAGRDRASRLTEQERQTAAAAAKPARVTLE